MPFDPTPAPLRPFMRHGSADLATMVAARPARDVLTAIAAELEHRSRPAARKLADEVRALLSVAPMVEPAIPADVVFEVVPCLHGEVLPEYRETVVEVVAPMPPPAPSYDPALWPNGPPSIGTRDEDMVDDTPPPAPVAKPPRKAAAKPAKPAPVKPATVRRPAADIMRESKRDRLKAAKQPPAMMWPGDAAGAIGNPMKEARRLALLADGWRHDCMAGEYMVWALGDARLRMGPYGAIYLGSATWVQMDKAGRDALTDAGRPLLEAILAAEAAKAKRAEARAKMRARRREAAKALAAWRKAQGTPAAKWNPPETRKAILSQYAKDRAKLMTIAA